MINGHPMALIMVSSLVKEKRLIQIYELLTMIEQESKDKKFSSQNVAINLSMEASIMFLKNVDYDIYMSLVLLSLVSAGLSDNDSFKIIGENWDEHKQILLSKSIILERARFSNQLRTSESEVVLSKASGKFFRIEETYKSFIKLRATSEELKTSEEKITSFLNNKLKEMYAQHHEDELVFLEENMWEALQRIKRQSIIDNKPVWYSQKTDNLSDEESWLASDIENYPIEDHIELKPVSSKAKSVIKKQGTFYEKRKEETFNKFLRGLDKDEEFFTEEPEFSKVSSVLIHDKPSLDKIADMNAKAKAQEEETKKETEKQKPTKRLSLFSKLFSKGKSDDDEGNLFKEVTSVLIKNKENAEFQSMLASLKRPIEIDDINITEKSENEAESDKEKASQNVLEIFQHNKSIKQMSKGKPSLFAVMLENARNNLSSLNYKRKNHDPITPKINLSKMKKAETLTKHEKVLDDKSEYSSGYATSKSIQLKNLTSFGSLTRQCEK